MRSSTIGQCPFDDGLDFWIIQIGGTKLRVRSVENESRNDRIARRKGQRLDNLSAKKPSIHSVSLGLMNARK